MLTISEKRRRRSMMKSAALLILAAIVFTPKVEQIELPDFGIPFVTVAVAAGTDYP